MKSPENIRKDDPTSWINRPMNGFLKVRKELCAAAERFDNLREFAGKYVTDSQNGMTLILCRYLKQGDEEFMVPVSIDEGKSWNVPVSVMINAAVYNMQDHFPASITDVDTGNTFIFKRSSDDIDKKTGEPRMYSFKPIEVHEVAEDESDYENESLSRLRFIVNASACVGEALLFYPGLLAKLGNIVGRDPLILSAAPGKLYIFDSSCKRNALSGYLKNYMERFSSDSFEPHMYKYFRINRTVFDLTPLASSAKNILQKAHIPQGSIMSAWGDVSYRCSLLETNQSK